MAKMIISIGYKDYVMDSAKAMAVIDAMGSAELFESRYRNVEEGGSTFHIWEQTIEESSNLSLKLLPDSLYRLAKLAGKRTE